MRSSTSGKRRHGGKFHKCFKTGGETRRFFSCVFHRIVLS
ncbi:hypothetical protein SUBVAR_05367 [Subdoligranulum variabile DSM 15176]|uniref:Uncharacterized protein n=1 Tax=Subdoligranulum variabile DSM 15176 TaxID=411471 RepID=D1PLI2_9FIRM|nr:hypothetical protein SUBVAR_05367 [Subdoligranulum variabile DSM 15176]